MTGPAAQSPTIIVTGASSGIGAHCARALKAAGWRVFATARKDQDIEALRNEGFEAFYLDYREPESIEALVAAVMERTGGRLDALYNNGAHAQAGAVEDLPVEALREQFEAGPVRSNIHRNGMTWFLKHVDYGNSHYRDDYRAQLEQVREANDKVRADPAVVYRALHHALVSRRPRPHYVVTVPARIGVLMKRLLPAGVLYRILSRTA